MIDQLIPNSQGYRWTCPVCGYHRSDYGTQATSLIQARHVCKENPLSENKTVILLCWEELDRAIDEIMDLRGKVAGDHPMSISAQAYARGMAAIMVKWTVPHFRTTAEISAEALERYKARQAGEERHTLGTMIGTAGADLAATFARQGVATRPARPAPAPTKRFSDADAQAIRNAHAGGFDMKMLTTAYGCTEADIKAVLGA